MLKTVTVTNYLGESLEMELVSPEKSGLIIYNITGLGPGQANINVTELATNDGGLYNSAHLSSRNIVMFLRFMFDPTIEDVRQMTYKYFPIKKDLKLVIETDNRLAEITGYVESNEPVIFQKEEYTQISIICPDPYFYSSGSDGITITIFYGVEPLFEFIWSNESLTEDLIEFGNIKNVSEELVVYSGDADVGVEIRINAIGEASNVEIHNVRTRESMSINTDKIAQITGVTSPSGYGILQGDEIIINTVKGAKSIQLLRGGIYTNILNAVVNRDKEPDWFQLSKGDNIFAYDAEQGAANLQFRIENRTIFEGV